LTDSHKGDQHVPHNLAAAFQAFPTPDVSQIQIDASQQLKDLYIADFEMARLKEMREATLLRLYIRIARFLPKAMMGVAGQGMKFIVCHFMSNALTP
jgi:hypothetical protein